MRSRIVLGIGAWLLGAAAATTGSLYAVGQLGHGMFAQQIRPVSIDTVNARLALEKAEPVESPSASPSSASPKARASRPASPSATSDAGQLLTTPAGTALATCQPAGAYLVYESPEPGYEIDRVQRGPSPAASVVFRDSGGGLVLRVTCSGGRPVAHVSTFGWDTGTGPDN